MKKVIMGLVILGCCILMFVLSPVGISSLETQTIILNNVSNSFPMFSNAEYVSFTIGHDTITLTLDSNASFDGVCNLSNLTGTDISAAGTYAELEYFPITYQNFSYDQKWESAPYFSDAEHKLYLLSGSGIITKSNLEIEENSTNKTIPKVVGLGDLVGDFHIETSAQGKNTTYNNLDSSISGVGYADLYVQYAPDTSYENITFIPTFSLCERLRLSTNTSGSLIGYSADVLGFANGVEYLNFDTIPLDDVAINETFDLEYHPVNISGEVYDEDWSVKPVQYDDTLVLLRGTGKIKLNFTFDDRNTAHPEIIGYGYLSGDVATNILPHYMNVIAIGTDVAAMDESGQGGFGITFASDIPDVEIPDVEIPDE